jgi:hypothetical protein
MPAFNNKNGLVKNKFCVEGRKMKKVTMILAVVMLMSCTALAVDVTGWNAFVIRNSNSGGIAPAITDTTEGKIFKVHDGGQKAGWGTNIANGQKVSDIITLSIDRLNDPGYGPYINIWIKDASGNFAVIANEPSDAEWVSGGVRNAWTDLTWDILKTKVAKVYETNGQPFILPSGSTYTFNDFADYIIATPSTNWGGGGAPDDLNASSYTAYGFNWIFGDSMNNYAADYGVANPSLTVPEPATMSLLAIGALSLIRRKK